MTTRGQDKTIKLLIEALKHPEVIEAFAKITYTDNKKENEPTQSKYKCCKNIEEPKRELTFCIKES